mmetsp:Transcript_11706/g.19882  ORF Transcript_11706/g.19882 Transcript_11706/m.19882 type:complete len:261 (-) Transcript_11706:473-1255(-)
MALLHRVPLSGPRIHGPPDRAKHALAQYRFMRNIVPPHRQWAIHPVLDLMSIGVDRHQMIQTGVLFSLPQELLDHVVVHRRELLSIPSLPRTEGEGLAQPAFREIRHVRIRAGVRRDEILDAARQRRQTLHDLCVALVLREHADLVAQGHQKALHHRCSLLGILCGDVDGRRQGTSQEFQAILTLQQLRQGLRKLPQGVTLGIRQDALQVRQICHGTVEGTPHCDGATAILQRDGVIATCARQFRGANWQACHPHQGILA